MLLHNGVIVVSQCHLLPSSIEIQKFLSMSCYPSKKRVKLFSNFTRHYLITQTQFSAPGCAKAS